MFQHMRHLSTLINGSLEIYNLSHFLLYPLEKKPNKLTNESESK